MNYPEPAPIRQRPATRTELARILATSSATNRMLAAIATLTGVPVDDLLAAVDAATAVGIPDNHPADAPRHPSATAWDHPAIALAEAACTWADTWKARPSPAHSATLRKAVQQYRTALKEDNR
jgi:hypothetical protein